MMTIIQLHCWIVAIKNLKNIMIRTFTYTKLILGSLTLSFKNCGDPFIHTVNNFVNFVRTNAQNSFFDSRC